MGIISGINFGRIVKPSAKARQTEVGPVKCRSGLLEDVFVKSLNNNNVSFNGVGKLEQFKKLSQEEQERILSVAKAFLSDANCPLTLIGEKAGSLVVVSKEDAETLRNHADLFDSNRFKVVVENLDAVNNKQRCNVYLVNRDDQMNMIVKNLDYLRYRLNDRKLTPEVAFDRLFSPESPIFDINNNHDLVGIVIGFPVADSLIFKLSRDIRQQMRFLTRINNGDTNAAKFLKLLDEMANQVKSPDVQSIMDKFGIKNPESPLNNVGGTYIFETWDKDSPEVKDIINKVPEAIEKAKSLLKQPEDILKLMLECR